MNEGYIVWHPNSGTRLKIQNPWYEIIHDDVMKILNKVYNGHTIEGDIVCLMEKYSFATELSNHPTLGLYIRWYQDGMKKLEQLVENDDPRGGLLGHYNFTKKRRSGKPMSIKSKVRCLLSVHKPNL